MITGGYRRLPEGSDDFSLQTDTHFIIIYISSSSSSYFEGASVLKKGQSASLDVLTTVQISARQGQSVCDRFEMIFSNQNFQNQPLDYFSPYLVKFSVHGLTERQTDKRRCT